MSYEVIVNTYNFLCLLGQSYKHLISMISSMELTDEQKLKFSQALKGFCPLKDVVAEIAVEFKLENKLNLVFIFSFNLLVELCN